MFTNNFDPIAFQIFSLEIRWYSLAYIAGILLGWQYCKRGIIKNPKISNLFDDFITYLIIGIILGGRIGYALLYNLKYYLENPIEIFMIWNGGMSFHGGLIGVVIVTIFFSKKYNVDKFIFLDLVAMSSPIGIFFGRIANFMNSELYGRPTEFFLSVKFVSIDNISRHPSQLYEAFLEGIFLFLILLYFKKKNYLEKPGLTSGLFLIFYSIFRFIAEFFRVPDKQLGYLIFNLSMGQIISLLFIFLGIILFYFKNENRQIN
jgi:phosphatidylglycerol---prolipoprotein diacylglyceryl transferase